MRWFRSLRRYNPVQVLRVLGLPESQPISLAKAPLGTNFAHGAFWGPRNQAACGDEAP